jgi:Caspase domain
MRSLIGSSGTMAALIGVVALVHAQPQPPRDLTLAAGRRVALVIGIDNYPRSPLLNARNDARAMASSLRELGFAVTLLEDITRNQMVGSVSEFSEALRPDDVAFFFYAGHGVQLEGENYLVPADFDGSSSTAARLNTMPVGELQSALGRAKLSVIVLDACRNNPFGNARSGGRGLAPVEARGNIIAFATGAGQTASDNPAAGNGLFTEQLLATLREPNLPLREIFYRVRQRVYQVTNGQQFPAVYDGLLGELVLRPDPTAGPVPPVAVVPNISAASPAAVPPPPATVLPPSAPVAPSYPFIHQGRSGLTGVTHTGVLTVSPGRVQWAEAPGNAKDDFSVSCAELGEISSKSRYSNTPETSVFLRVKNRNFDLFLPDEAPNQVRPLPSKVVEAIKAACPAVKVKN